VPTHPFPWPTRLGYQSIPDFIAGHVGNTKPGAKRGIWMHQRQKNLLISTGFRWQYTILVPVTQTADPKSNLFFNFHPNPGSTDSEILNMVESDRSFFEHT
jgi:hypothetical protein